MSKFAIIAGLKRGGALDIQMDVIEIRFQRQQGEPMPFATFGDQTFRLRLHFARQDFSAILRDPDQVISNRVVGIPGLAHLQNFLVHGIIIP